MRKTSIIKRVVATVGVGHSLQETSAKLQTAGLVVRGEHESINVITGDASEDILEVLEGTPGVVNIVYYDPPEDTTAPF